MIEKKITKWKKRRKNKFLLPIYISLGYLIGGIAARYLNSINKNHRFSLANMHFEEFLPYTFAGAYFVIVILLLAAHFTEKDYQKYLDTKSDIK